MNKIIWKTIRTNLFRFYPVYNLDWQPRI